MHTKRTVKSEAPKTKMKLRMLVSLFAVKIFVVVVEIRLDVSLLKSSCAFSLTGLLNLKIFSSLPEFVVLYRIGARLNDGGSLHDVLDRSTAKRLSSNDKNPSGLGGGLS